MHSATEAALRKLDLIDFIPDSKGKSMLRTFQGRRVVVDDNLPTRAGTTDGTVYTSYLFGQGAFAKGSARLDSKPLQGGEVPAPHHSSFRGRHGHRAVPGHFERDELAASRHRGERHLRCMP